MDNRSVTSKKNGALGGRPKELSSFKAMIGEVFRPIPGFAGYFASSYGRIISVKHDNPKLRKQSIDKAGYATIILSKYGKKYYTCVHRLILKAFDGLPAKGMEGSHLNGVKSDNNITNLSWETKKDNNKRKYGHGTMCKGESIGTSKLIENQVKEIRKTYDKRQGMTQLLLAKKYNVGEATIREVINRITWKHIK